MKLRSRRTCVLRRRHGAKAAQAVRDATSIGYRNIDTAQAYGYERGVGEGGRSVVTVTTLISSRSGDTSDPHALSETKLTPQIHKIAARPSGAAAIFHNGHAWEAITPYRNRTAL